VGIVGGRVANSPRGGPHPTRLILAVLLNIDDVPKLFRIYIANVDKETPDII
jgi:hypothetical protein